jgi:hypothetical protein
VRAGGCQLTELKEGSRIAIVERHSQGVFSEDDSGECHVFQACLDPLKLPLFHTLHIA